ncbi:MAG: thiamine pyrophosphate-dependent enzyme [Chloroflexi bacterium]|nr:thiamine pyrophosphate-dependent enzyme [Chloroflexota bacterium]
MDASATQATTQQPADLPLSREVLIQDYRTAYRSRQASITGRREVLSGKAKFGIFGDGKELPQIAMARAFRPGDFRSGYYRDQTFMFAIGELSVQAFFAQLYAHADVRADPATAGRAMNGHYATRSLHPDGSWKNLTGQFNAAADVSPTAAQMPRLVGLALASRLYREVEELRSFEQFSRHGDEVAFGTIGNASTAEGMFWEAVNAIGVLKAPAVITIYDDGYGISVPNQYQMLKENISKLLRGFRREKEGGVGYDVYTVCGWDYPALLEAYFKSAENARCCHTPSIIHVVDLTQPLGHSTSGSHERYKSPERLQWEQLNDGLKRMREWLVDNGLASDEELTRAEAEEHQLVDAGRKAAWLAYMQPLEAERKQAAELIAGMAQNSTQHEALLQVSAKLQAVPNPLRRESMAAIQQALLLARGETSAGKTALLAWLKEQEARSDDRYHTYLHSHSPEAALNIQPVALRYAAEAPLAQGFEVLNACFDAALARDPRVIAFGEDVGRLGDVNQAFHGLQEKYGNLRVADTGIREATILGQAIGLALRGLRPIAEIQYLDYLLYALQIMSDDLATLLWRTKGGQKAPVIVRTRGHRLEGMWHSGSPMAGIIHLVRGMHVLVPRDMTRAAGFYNTLLRADEPALVVEVLNGYRLRERMPENIGAFNLPLGAPEVIREGSDVTLVTYGACCRIALEAAERLSLAGIAVEVVDVQTLLPFDLRGVILDSLKKTSRILFVDEDVPGGTTAYMFQQVIEGQGGYAWLDSPPRTLSAQPHRPAYGSDGDYWSKPNAEQIFAAVYELMGEAAPARFLPLEE